MIQADGVTQSDGVLGVHIDHPFAEAVHHFLIWVADSAIGGFGVGVDLENVGVNSDAEDVGSGSSSGQLCTVAGCSAVTDQSVTEGDSSAGLVREGTSNVSLQIANQTLMTLRESLG